MKKVIFFIILLECCLLLSACRSTTQDICPASELLLEQTSFPRDVEVGELTSPLPDGSVYSIGRTYYLGQGIANHSVYPYSKEQQTIEKYQYFAREPVFSSLSNGWEAIAEPRDFQISADRYEFRCGEQHGIPMCKFIARYGNYFVYFNVHTYPEEISDALVFKLLEDIDNRMIMCLNDED